MSKWEQPLFFGSELFSMKIKVSDFVTFLTEKVSCLIDLVHFIL